MKHSFEPGEMLYNIVLYHAKPLTSNWNLHSPGAKKSWAEREANFIKLVKRDSVVDEQTDDSSGLPTLQVCP